MEWLKAYWNASLARKHGRREDAAFALVAICLARVSPDQLYWTDALLAFAVATMIVRLVVDWRN